MYACLNGHREVADRLLAVGSRSDFQDKTGKTALILASERGLKEIVKLFAKFTNRYVKVGTGESVLILATTFARRKKAMIDIKDEVLYSPRIISDRSVMPNSSRAEWIYCANLVDHEWPQRRRQNTADLRG